MNDTSKKALHRGHNEGNIRQQIQRPLPITMVSQSLQNVKMLDIQILCSFPIQRKTNK